MKAGRGRSNWGRLPRLIDRLVVSDGVFQWVVMVDKKRYSVLEKAKKVPKLYDIISITKVNITTVAGRPVWILGEVLNVIYTDIHRIIGKPKDYATHSKDKSINIEEADIAISFGTPSPKKDGSSCDEDQTDINNDSPTKEGPIKLSESIDEKHEFTPIRAINSFLPEWKLRAKVTRKGEIKTWSNSRGTGYLLNIELTDSKGDQIQATFFKEAVDAFDPIIEEGAVYTFTNGTVKQANKKFTSIQNDFCLHFGTDAEIQRIQDDSSIKLPEVKHQTLNEICEMENGKCVNTVGVVIDISEIEKIRLRAGGEKEKRMVSIADNSVMPGGWFIKIWFWGNQVHQLDFNWGDIVAFRSLRVSDFNGKSLNTSQETTHTVDPDCKQNKKLSRWFKDIKSIEEMKALTHDRNDAEKRSNENVRLISELNHSLWGGQIPHNGFFILNGFVTYIKADDKTTYLGCPTCHRKLFKDYDNNIRCENCNITLDNEGEAIYMLCAKINDASSSVFVNFYRSNAEPIMGGMTAAEYNAIRPWDKNDLDGFKEVINSNFFKMHSILLKVRAEQYNDNEYRYKYVGTKVLDYSFKKDNWNLLDRLELYSEKPDLSEEELRHLAGEVPIAY
jgi:replication factor A1